MTGRQYDSIINHIRKATQLYSRNKSNCEQKKCSNCIFAYDKDCIFKGLHTVLNTADQAMLIAPPSRP
jgi:hypothetical protein